MTDTFDDAMRDPQLRSEAAKMGLPADNFVSGKELETIIADLMATPASVVELMNSMMKP